MIDPQLLDILVCPETRQPVRPAEPTLLDTLNRAIAEGRLENRVGQVLAEPLTGALVREDEAAAYPIIDGIPVMLVDEAIRLDQVS